MRQARDKLREAGVADADLEAEVLLCHAFAIDSAWLYANPEAPPPAGHLPAFVEHLHRRAQREPLAYIIGGAQFYGREFAVDPRVLIPRPETELLVERAKSFAGQLSAPGRTTLRVADVGTGSGILAITLALELSRAEVHAVDVSAGALEVARGNATRHRVENRVRFHQGDLASPLSGTFDVVVANLPYIRSGDLAGRQPELGFEPRSALDGGDDGMRYVGPLIADLPRLLAERGLALLEIDPPIAAAAVRLARSMAPGARVAVLDDLAGLNRVLEIGR
ncbi:MAG: peptide chain release factor N(5)-glutamine methyltransferase [Chloroflexi bacterium]|nr:peptide chain release factor N(5)-glutamine methyltransferase [Chloroflexota bacterium]